MPLPPKDSKNCIGDTIDKLMQEGRSYEQALAIALSRCKKRKQAKSGKAR